MLGHGIAGKFFGGDAAAFGGVEFGGGENGVREFGGVVDEDAGLVVLNYGGQGATAEGDDGRAGSEGFHGDE